MNKKNYLGITADCICDLPIGMQEQCDINLIYFYVETEHGKFRDMEEITAENALEYMIEGDRKIFLSAPSVDDYVSFFRKYLAKFGELIHISVSSLESSAYSRAVEAVAKMGFEGKKVHVIDSQQISCGMSIMILQAYDMIIKSSTVQEITNALIDMRDKITVQFVIDNPYYLFLNKRISKRMYAIFEFFQVHPVLEIKEGKMVIKNFVLGSYSKASRRYARRLLKKNEFLNRRLFIANCECKVEIISSLRDEIKAFMDFKDVIVTRSCASVATHTGLNSFGICYRNK